MDIERYLGYKLVELEPLLHKNHIEYKIIEVFDTKNTKLGNDLRVINIRKTNLYEIYVAYF